MKRLLLLLLALMTVLCACGDGGATNSTTLAGGNTTPSGTEVALDSRYTIVRSGSNNSGAEAAIYLRNAIEAVTGTRLNIIIDRTTSGQAVAASEYEILVGLTNRPASAEFSATLLRDDWSYNVNGGQILICGGDADATLDAVKAFCTDLLGYTGKAPDTTKSVTLSATATRTYKYKYPITGVTLSNRPITDYVLAIANQSVRSSAVLFNDLLANRSGIELPIVLAADVAAGTPVIAIGEQNDTTPAYYYTASKRNGALTFTGDEITLPYIIEEYLTAGLAGSGNARLTMPTQNTPVCWLSHNGLTYQSKTDETIATGVVYSKRNYVDKNGAPVVMHLLIVEPGAASVINGTPNGGTVTSGVNATTVQAATAAESQGYDVLAGTNADFFRITSDFSPQGICIKNGEVLNSDSSNPYFGVKTDGSFIIAEASTLATEAANLQEAVGGKQILIKNGELFNVEYDTDFGVTRHPRTAVGFDDDGRLYLMVVDGRQSAVSNGASLTDMGMLLLEVGATEGLNMDGGGSSTFIVDNGAGGFTVKNSPSDGQLRYVYNSLLVVAND